jgi:hypothetical protein
MGDVMKLRIAKSEWARVQECARAIGEPALEWVRRVCRKYRRDVVNEHGGENPTSGEVDAAVKLQTVVDCHEAHAAWVVRACIRKGLAYCEARKPEPFVTSLVEGRDFVVGKAE